MSEALDKAEAAIAGFFFRKGDQAGALTHLLRFAHCYAALTPDEARVLRDRHDLKTRLGWFSTAANLLHAGETEADIHDLLTIFFALYSFDGLDFGHDTLLHLAKAAGDLRANGDLARRTWDRFAPLTSRPAVRAMEAQVSLLRPKCRQPI